MSTSIAAVILTFNEEKHIMRCIESINSLTDKIYVVDSYSTDKTVEIATKLGANVYQNRWINYSNQFNWALRNCPISAEWIWRIDADEFIENPENIDFLKSLYDLDEAICGVYIKKKMVFMRQALMHGGWYPVWHLKIWRKGKGFCENRWMDEHIKLTEGKTVNIGLVQVDENLNNLSWWTQKHNGYATREMIDMLNSQFQINVRHSVSPNIFGTDEQRKRWLKLKYLHLPLFFRPFLYFLYRYLIRLGFLDGMSGLVWHVLQGFWYRCLVDAKIYELKQRFDNRPELIIEHIKNTYKIDESDSLKEGEPVPANKF